MSYNKYNARKLSIDGHTFDSKMEAERYLELKALELAGEIGCLKLQPRFLLQEGFEYQGEKIRKMEYVADFQYTDMNTGATVVEDVKGVRTEAYKLKRKLFLSMYGDLVNFIEIGK